MGAWSPDSKTNVATMGADDFRNNEQSVVLAGNDQLTIRHVAADGTTTVLKDSLAVLEGEVVDATVMRAASLDAFLREQIARAKAQDVLFSVHLKATMMKVIDPIIFGHVVRAFLPEVFERFGADLDAAGLSPNNGLGGILDGLADLPNGDEIRAAIEQGLADGPRLAMVNSDKGITNLHVPSHVIVDASRPAMIRTSGHMWVPDGAEADTLAVIPRQLLLRRLPDRHRRLPRQRRLRPDHDGLGAERGPDGPEGRGVRPPRQDLRDLGCRSRRGRRRQRHGAHVARRRPGRHLARLPDQGRLGRAGLGLGVGLGLGRSGIGATGCPRGVHRDPLVDEARQQRTGHDERGHGDDQAVEQDRAEVGLDDVDREEWPGVRRHEPVQDRQAGQGRDADLHQGQVELAGDEDDDRHEQDDADLGNR
jgi:hypothetical protein